MSKFMTLDKQVEQRAKKWFMGKQVEGNERLARKWFEENKKEVIDEYLEKHPKIKEQYQTKKKQLLRVKLLLAGVGVVATTLAGVYVAKSNSNQNNVEMEQEIEEIDNLEEKEKETDTSYKTFFEEARNTESTKRREELITNQTKQIIVDAYNQENPENPITIDQLETLILDEFVLEKKDRVGNCTYERVAQNVQYEQTESQKLVKIGGLYDFRIDGKTVAVFDKNGNPMQDKNVEKQDMNFQKMIQMMKESEKLKDIYRYPSNDTEKAKAEQSYEKMANQLLEKYNEKNVEKSENEKM